MQFGEKKKRKGTSRQEMDRERFLGMGRDDVAEIN